MSTWTPPPAPGPDATRQETRRYERAVKAGQRAYRQTLGPWWKDPVRVVVPIVVVVLIAGLVAVVGLGLLRGSSRGESRGTLGDELAPSGLAVTASNLRNPDDATGQVCVDVTVRSDKDTFRGFKAIHYVPRDPVILAGGKEVAHGSTTTLPERLLPGGTTSGTQCFEIMRLEPGDYQLRLGSVDEYLWDFSVA